MASEGSYTITLANNLKEGRGIAQVCALDPTLLIPSTEGRKQILEALGLEKKFARAFDLFQLPGHTNNERAITVGDASNLTLIELKTTAKHLPNNPEKFFFGATQNEFDLAQSLGEQYKFCFVSLHPNSATHVLLSLDELEKRVRTKRVQYQINLA